MVVTVVLLAPPPRATLVVKLGVGGVSL